MLGGWGWCWATNEKRLSPFGQVGSALCSVKHHRLGAAPAGVGFGRGAGVGCRQRLEDGDLEGWVSSIRCQRTKKTGSALHRQCHHRRQSFCLAHGANAKARDEGCSGRVQALEGEECTQDSRGKWGFGFHSGKVQLCKWGCGVWTVDCDARRRGTGSSESPILWQAASATCWGQTEATKERSCCRPDRGRHQQCSSFLRCDS